MPRWKFSTDDEYRAHWIERVRARCVIDERGCWVWQGFCSHKGYGMTNYLGHRNMNLHRAMWLAVHKTRLTFEQQVCHSCDNRKCCNPEHLWIGSNADNHRDKDAKGRNYFTNLTHCKHGHPFTPENTTYKKQRKTQVTRVCKTCQKIAHSKESYIAWRKEYQKQRRQQQQRKRSQVSI